MLFSRLLKVFFYLLYHPMAWSYDLVAWAVSLGRWKHWVYRALPYLPGPRVLELGHGPGHLQLALHKQGAHAFGLDRSPQMSGIARKRLANDGLPALLVNAAASQLPYAARSFDQLVATFPSEYILEHATLSEIQRVLRPNGTLVVLPVAWITGSGWLERTAAWLFRVTGQATEWTGLFANPIRRAGFDVSEEQIDLGSSLVMLLICRQSAV